MKTELPNLASYETCTGCLACKDICRQKAISAIMEDDGHVYVNVDAKSCIGCKMCERLCLGIHSGYASNDLINSTVYAGWTKNVKIRRQGTSGGIFGALAVNTINNGGAVVGVAFDGLNAGHKMVYDAKEIAELQGSKYVYSSMDGLYSEIEKVLPTQKVLFSGTGCQCAAVIEYFKTSKYKQNLLTLDLVCGGVPSHCLIDHYIKDNPDIEKIISFRTKDKYELKVKKTGKTSVDNSKSLPLAGYSAGLTNRLSCYNCQFVGTNRKSDITIGDLWNRNLFQEERENGISIVIPHTSVGMKTLADANINLIKLNWADVLPTNKRIVYGQQSVLSPRINLSHNFAVMNETELKKMYCIDINYTDLRWMIYRVKRRLINQKDTKKSTAFINKLLKSEGDNSI